MDVQCERCKTEYEFDDALVSGRGTTVRCSNCGHQFKVRKAESSAPDADRWVVRTESGEDLVFVKLRDLQQAILARQVGRSDVLRRGNSLPRLLGTIAELDPFFEGRTSSRPPPPWGDSDGSMAPRSPQLSASDAAPMFPKRTASWGAPTDQRPAFMRPRSDTLRPDGVSGAAPPPRPPSVSTLAPLGGSSAEAPPVSPQDPDGSGGEGSSQAYPTQQVPADLELSSPLPPPTAPVRHRSSHPDDDFADATRSAPWSGQEHDDLYSARRRRKVGGWIVALVLMVAVGVVGSVVVKPYLKPKPAMVSTGTDSRALAFVNEGERAMSDGNLEAAQEAFDKATALAERDPRALIDQARVAAAKADIPWLKARLLPPDAKDEIRATKDELSDRVARARRGADAALAAAPDDVGALRAHIDALRLSGEQEAARREVSRISAQASQPETAYVLAALDLSQGDPLWTTLIDRLRLAASAEGNAGRARAALVYALARSGDVASAKAELAKVDALARAYPLLPALHSFLERSPSRPVADGGLATAAATADAAAVLPSGRPVMAAGAVAHDGEDPGIPSESAGAMKAAQAAIHKGDWSRARAIYAATVARNPTDSEALAGLGDVARAQGDLPLALADYKRVLVVNPSYLPALMGVADTEWAMGDRAAAARAYKDIVDRFPEATYPSYVRSRTDAANGSPGGGSGPSAASSASPASSTVPISKATTSAAPANSDGL